MSGSLTTPSPPGDTISGSIALIPLTDIPFRRDYTPENCADFIADYYEPALAQAVRYDQTTCTFSAAGLQTTARGVAGLPASGGYIRVAIIPDDGLCHMRK